MYPFAILIVILTASWLSLRPPINKQKYIEDKAIPPRFRVPALYDVLPEQMYQLPENSTTKAIALLCATNTCKQLGEGQYDMTWASDSLKVDLSADLIAVLEYESGKHQVLCDISTQIESDRLQSVLILNRRAVLERELPGELLKFAWDWNSSGVLFCPAEIQFTRSVVTLVTVLSVDRFERLKFIKSQWNNQPIIAVVYLTSATDTIILSKYYGQVHDTVTLVLVKQPREMRNFPINALRNIGISCVETNYHLIIDADFYPTRGLDQLIADKLHHRLAFSHEPVALVVPCLSLKQTYTDILPKDKLEILEVLRSQPDALYIPDVRAGHGITKSLRGLEPQIFSKDADFYEVCFESQWEPYYVLETSIPEYKLHPDVLRMFRQWQIYVSAGKYQWLNITANRLHEWASSRVFPWYDERFTNQGGDKQQHAIMLNALGYRFFVISDHFIIHLDHKYGEMKSWPGGLKDAYLKPRSSIDLFADYLPELERFFGIFFRWPRCPQAFVSSQQRLQE